MVDWNQLSELCEVQARANHSWKKQARGQSLSVDLGSQNMTDMSAHLPAHIRWRALSQFRSALEVYDSLLSKCGVVRGGIDQHSCNFSHLEVTHEKKIRLMVKRRTATVEGRYKSRGDVSRTMSEWATRHSSANTKGDGGGSFERGQYLFGVLHHESCWCESLSMSQWLSHRLQLALWGVLILALLSSPQSFVDAAVKRTRAQLIQQQFQNATSIKYRDTLTNIRAVNATLSYDLVTKLALKHFEFKYDAHAGRTQLGCIGDEIQHLFPDGVHFVPERFVFDQERQRIALRDFYVIDKDALFMHNLAATQVVISEQQEHEQELYTLRRKVAEHQAQIEELQKYLDQEASVQLVEQRKIAEAEVARAEKLIEEARARGEEERQTLETKKKNDLEVEDAKHELAQRRLQDEDAARLSQNRDLVALQEESTSAWRSSAERPKRCSRSANSQRTTSARSLSATPCSKRLSSMSKVASSSSG